MISEFLENKKIDDQLFEKDYIEFLNTLLKYILKVLHNTSDFIIFCLDNNSDSISLYKEKTNTIINFIIYKIFSEINPILINNRTQIVFENNNTIFLKVIKLLSTFNKSLKKEFHYNTSKFISISDFIISHDINFENKIKLQKSFTSNFLKNQIKDKLHSTINKNEFNIEEIFENIKIILKDNFQFILIFEKNPNLFESALEKNMYFTFKEILNILRNSYNEEVQIFSLKKNISKKKILFLLDIIIKILVFINKLNEKNKIISSKEEFSEIINDINKMIDNFTVIITKELRSNGFDNIIEMFNYENLIKLEEEKINENFNKIKNLIKILFLDLDNVKVNVETENYFFNSLLTTLITKIYENCENSLKKIPRNKNFNLLTDKTNKIIDEILFRYTISPNTLESVNKIRKNLNNCFSLLNLNKI